MRTSTFPPWRSPQNAPHGGLSAGAALIPTGYATAWVVADRRPEVTLSTLAAITVALALLHHLLPGLVEAAVGAGGLVASTFAVTDRPGCGDLLGGPGQAVVLGFASVLAVSAFVCLLGGGGTRDAARHLLVATAALGLGVVVLHPLLEGVLGLDRGLSRSVVLVSALLAVGLVGVRARAGLPLLGGALVAVHAAQAWQATGDPCALDPAVGLTGMLAFAVAGLVLATPPPDEHPHARRPRPRPRRRIPAPTWGSA